MALTGHLSDLSLSELIEFFCNQRKTGRLKVLYSQGPGYFFLQQGSVVDARIGVLRGIDAVYYALTLPNAKFEFSGTTDPGERTINQPWTQVVLEGLRRLDEGIVPSEAFPATYSEPPDTEATTEQPSVIGSETDSAVPGFLSFLQPESIARRKYFVIGSVVVAVLASVAVIGVPAGWYSRPKAAAATVDPNTKMAEVQPTPAAEAAVTPQTTTTATAESQPSEDPDAAARHQRERDRIRPREERVAAVARNVTSAAVSSANDGGKSGPRKVTVTVTYDESGRVVQASGADATAIRIARQKRFPAGKAGSATVTIPIN
jgi:Domain of unknown function (DUF4388)